MTYNMEPFFRSCVDKYLALARELGFNANLRNVPTPFLNEDHANSPQGKPCGDGPALYCPCCRHAFPYSESLSDAQLRAAQREREGKDSVPLAVGVTVGCDPNRSPDLEGRELGQVGVTES